MRLGIIGCGAIGTDVAVYADTMNEIEKIYLFDIDKKAEAMNKGPIQIIKVAFLIDDSAVNKYLKLTGNFFDRIRRQKQ